MGTGEIILVSWNFQVVKAAEYEMAVTYSCQPGAEGSRFTVEVGHQKLIGTSKPTQSWSTYRTESLGKVRISEPGICTLAVRPNAEPAWKVIGLQSIILNSMP